MPFNHHKPKWNWSNVEWCSPTLLNSLPCTIDLWGDRWESSWSAELSRCLLSIPFRFDLTLEFLHLSLFKSLKSLKSRIPVAFLDHFGSRTPTHTWRSCGCLQSWASNKDSFQVTSWKTWPCWKTRPSGALLSTRPYWLVVYLPWFSLPYKPLEILTFTAWWRNNNLEKYEFVSWDDDIPVYGNIKNVPNHQPA